MCWSLVVVDRVVFLLLAVVALVVIWRLLVLT